MKTTFVALAVTAVAAVGSVAAAPSPYQLGESSTGDRALAAQVREAAGDEPGYRGLSVVLVDGQAMRTAGVGDAGPARVDAATRFEIGSVTKTLTGMLLADMVDDGTVRADEPLRALLPGVRFSDPPLVTSPWKSSPATAPACPGWAAMSSGTP